MTSPLLSVSSLAVARGGLLILDGVSFEVEAGKALILRGPNGAGKTSLLRTLAGLQPAAGGEIQAEPDAIAYAAHSDGLKATLTVEENLAFWAGLFGQTDVADAIASFDLETLADRAAHMLSAGQKRRVGLARLLVTGRPLWLLDEPTVSLDEVAKTQFVEAIKKHLDRGGAAIIATHIDLGLDAPSLGIGQFRATQIQSGSFDEAFS
ncbi:MAG: heme ABC exporter ATP-binding protein CcmA [Boseongicola sp.]|nr:heme ABC exporter ATP-binding protein CcmA [Boseongicola sp.]MDD9977737.1 heme ABC exporter ATP-binding protein CcmA [Boseongicola sp.]